MTRICFSLLSLALLGLSFPGCGPKEDENKSIAAAKNMARPELTGTHVLNEMFSAYANADSYSDKAVLYMTYRTEAGRPMQEPMPWAVSFQKQSQKFSGQFFDSVVKYDGRTLGCRVFDIESDNQDNQFLLIPGATLPFDQLLTDKLALRFVGGHEEVPLRTGASALVDALLPPTIKLLTGQASFPWFTEPDSVTRLEDQTIEGVVCFHVQSSFRKQICDIWIEQETGLIHQLLFPNSVFTDDVANSNRIRDLKIVGRFHNCKFNHAAENHEFAVVAPEGASLVTEFVTLPEAFPSELIGKRTPRFTLRTPGGKAVENSQFVGKPTALLWIAGFAASEGINKFDEFARRFSENANFGVLYSDAEMEDPSGATFALSASFQKTNGLKNLQVPFFCDHHLDVSSLLQIKAIPSVVVLDENLKIQYARALSGTDWASEAEAAIQRVIRGEDIAQEMIDEYGKFYSAYRSKLFSVAYDRKSVAAQPASAKMGQGTTRTLWTNDTLLQPGNIASTSIDGQSRLAVLDGYRTAVVLDQSGNQLVRRELELPQNQAVTRIRVGEFQRRLVVAAFSKLGSQVHWFDENLELLGSYPQVVDQNIKIADCQFAEADNSSGLIVSLQGDGICQVNLTTSEGRKLSDFHAEELTAVGNQIGGIRDGKPFSSKLPELNRDLFAGWHLSDIESTTWFAGNRQGRTFCATGSIDGEWRAIGLNDKFVIQWKADIGEQDFKNDIEPLAVDPNSHLWLVANSDYGFSVIDNNGEVQHLMRSDHGLGGIASLPGNDKLRVAFSDGREIRCVEFDNK